MADISFREMVPVPANVEGNCPINGAVTQMFLEKTSKQAKAAELPKKAAFYRQQWRK